MGSEKMATFSTAEINTWFQTIDGLPVSPTTPPIPSNLSMAYVAELTSVPPTTSVPQVQAQLENQTAPPPNNVATDTFYRTSVAQFVLRDFQAAWGVVPTTTQYDAWVARIIANPSLENGGMSQALVGTPQFLAAYGLTSSSQLATTGFINQLLVNLGLNPATHPGAFNNVGVPVAQVLQNFVTSQPVIASLNTPIVNFQNALLAGGTFPTGSILTVGPGGALNLTTGIDTPTAGFSGGQGGTATAAGATFSAQPGTNVLGLSNTLNAGDILLATGAAAGNSTLNYTAVPSLAGNGPNPVGVTMTGVSAAVITNLDPAGVEAGFSGTITGLTTATLTAISTGPVELGTAANGLITALTTVNVNASHNFTAHMTAAALAAAPTATVNVNGGVTTVVALDSPGTTGYASLTVNSAGPGGTTANDLTLNLNEGAGTTNTTALTVTGAEALVISGSALDIDNLHNFTGTAATGDLTVTFTNADGAGHVAAVGGSGDDTFTFDATAAGAASFLSTSSVNGGTGTTNTLDIQADTGAILLAGVGPNITGIHTIENTGTATGALTADLALMTASSATTFDLAGAYGGNTISVTDITNAQTVEFSGSGGHLTLAHTTPLGTDALINFEMNSTGTAALTLAQLSVGPGLLALNVDSTGTASDNVITNVTGVDDNVAITGATHLTFGSHADPYTFIAAAPAGGTIDASADTGGVTTWLGDVGLNAGVNAAQTFVGGTGGDTVHVLNTGGDVVNFTTAGTDVVSFERASVSSVDPIADPAHFYNQVVGFTNANDTLNIVAPGEFVATGGALTNTNSATGVAAGDATNVFDFTTGALGENATTAAFNYIKVTTPITAGAGASIQTAFADAIGGGDIDVSGAHARLLSFYDNSTSQAVFVSVNTGAATLTAADHVNVIGLIHESAADYALTSPHFVALA
jgi:hypothetical protein